MYVSQLIFWLVKNLSHWSPLCVKSELRTNDTWLFNLCFVDWVSLPLPSTSQPVLDVDFLGDFDGLSFTVEVFIIDWGLTIIEYCDNGFGEE